MEGERRKEKRSQPPCKCKQNKPKTTRRTKPGSCPLPDTAQQLVIPPTSQAAFQQMPSSHPFATIYQPSTSSAGEPLSPKKLQPKSKWAEEQPGEGRGGEGHSKSLCSFIISGRELPLHESILKALSPVPGVMAHRVYLQPNCSNSTSFWLINSLVLVLCFVLGLFVIVIVILFWFVCFFFGFWLVGVFCLFLPPPSF